MKKANIKFLFIIYSLFFINNGHSEEIESKSKLCPAFRKSLEWEFWGNSSNDTSRRGRPHFMAQHYEVPVKFLGDILFNEVKNLSRIYNALFFYKTWNGQTEKYIRWVINPEDTKFHKIISEFLLSNGYDNTPKEYFIGHLTSSRSIYLEDPITHFVFSIKMSTNMTGGKWISDKKVDRVQVIDSFNFSKLALTVEKKHKFDHLYLLKEPFTAHINQKALIDGQWQKIDQGMIIRDLGPILSCGHYYLPGFSALHEEVGASIAEKNESKAGAFWAQFYAKSLGVALGEFSAYFGMGMTSSHSQQFLIELDMDFRATGKIVLRDFNDSQILRTFYQHSDDENVKKFLDYCSNTFNGRYVRSYHKVFFGILHGSERPSWLLKKTYKKHYIPGFIGAYENTFSRLTGISQTELDKGKIKEPKNIHNYYSKKYTILKLKSKGLGWKRYFKYVDCFLGTLDSVDKQKCTDILLQIGKSPL